MGLSAGSACRRRPRRAGPLQRVALTASQLRGAPLPAREVGEKGAREGKPRRVFCLRGKAAKTGTSLFPHGACLIGSFTLSIAKKETDFNSYRTGDMKDVIASELRAVGRADFGRATGYVTRVRETEFRSAR